MSYEPIATRKLAIFAIFQSALLRLPVEAVRPGGRVWKFEDGKLNIVRVTQAHVEGDNVLIYANESELEAGDQVIISPLASAYQDMKVQLPGDEKETVN